MLSIKDLEPKFKINMELKEGSLKAEIEGSKTSLLTGLSLLAKNLKENGISEILIREAINTGLMTEEELIKDVDQKINELLNKLFKF